MAKKRQKFTVKEQLEVKNALVEKFKLEERQVGESWLDLLDIEPDPNEPAHWTYMLKSKEHNCYINLRHFPKIVIEPTHTVQYQLGIINYTKEMKPKDVVWYVNNILND